MSWTEIGAFGELIGAIGLFVSITFVACEMKLKREDEKAREYESLTLKTIELNLIAAQSPSLSGALSKWWQQTDGMWGKAKHQITEKEVDQIFSAEEKTALAHYWFSTMVWLNLALSKEERNSYDSSQNRGGFVNILEYARLFGSLDHANFPRISERFQEDSEKAI